MVHEVQRANACVYTYVHFGGVHGAVGVAAQLRCHVLGRTTLCGAEVHRVHRLRLFRLHDVAFRRFGPVGPHAKVHDADNCPRATCPRHPCSCDPVHGLTRSLKPGGGLTMQKETLYNESNQPNIPSNNSHHPNALNKRWRVPF